MVTQRIRPETLSADDWHAIFARPSAEGGTDEDEATASVVHSFDDYDGPEISQVIAAIAIDVLTTDSDQRLDYLRTVNPGLTDDHLDQIAVITERWLDRKARERIRAIARRCLDNRSDPSDMLDEWNTPQEINRLVGMLLETSIVDKTLATCYAMSVAHDAAFAAYFVHGERMNRKAGFAGIGQTSEEVAADLRFANSR